MIEILQKLFHLLMMILASYFLVTGCSSKSSIKYTESEIKVIPTTSFSNAFKPGENVIIKTNDYKTHMKILGYEENKLIIGFDEDQEKKVKIAISEIKEIEIIKAKTPKKKSKTYSSSEYSTAEEIVYSLPYLLWTPMLVTAPVLYPMVKSMEMTSRKTEFIYKGMTKDELASSIGEPKKKYLCDAFVIDQEDVWAKRKEVWEYDAEKVLHGAKFIFFSPYDQTVYYTTDFQDLKKTAHY